MISAYPTAATPSPRLDARPEANCCELKERFNITHKLADSAGPKEQLTLNQRVPGSSPGAPTKQIKHLARETV